MRVVVLDPDQASPRRVRARTRSRGSRVKIVGDELGLDVEHPLEACDPLAERDQCLVSPQVADVLADEGASPRPPSRRCSSARRRRPQGAALASGSSSASGVYPRERRSISGRPRAPAVERSTESSVRDLDRPIVDEEQVGDVGEPPQGILVAIGDRLVGEVRAGHHERRLGVGAQQVVKRGVGNHHAELRRARRDLLRHGRPLAAAGDHDRTRGDR